MPASELIIHDCVGNALRTEPPSTLVFTIEAARADPDAGVILSAFLERLSTAMLHWLCAKDAKAEAREEDVSTLSPIPAHGLGAGA